MQCSKTIFGSSFEKNSDVPFQEQLSSLSFHLQRYHGAHVLLHALQYHPQSQRDKEAVAKYKEAVEKRLQLLEEHGYVQAESTNFAN